MKTSVVVLRVFGTDSILIHDTVWVSESDVWPVPAIGTNSMLIYITVQVLQSDIWAVLVDGIGPVLDADLLKTVRNFEKKNIFLKYTQTNMLDFNISRSKL